MIRVLWDIYHAKSSTVMKRQKTLVSSMTDSQLIYVRNSSPTLQELPLSGPCNTDY